MDEDGPVTGPHPICFTYAGSRGVLEARLVHPVSAPLWARHLIPKQIGLRRGLVRYLRCYNPDRAHTGRLTRGRTPESVMGKAGAWS